MSKKDQPSSDAAEQIDNLLLEGLDSGEPVAVTPEYREEKKRRLEALQASIDEMTAGKGHPVEKMFAEMETLLAAAKAKQK